MGFGLRLWRLVLSFVVSLAVVVQGFVPASAVEPVVAPFVASDYLSGLAQARLRDHRVLIVSELSEVSSTWVNPDGSLTTETFGGPVRVRDVAGGIGGAMIGVGKAADRKELGTKKMWNYVRDGAVAGAISGGFKLPVFKLFSRFPKWKPSTINLARKVARGFVAGVVGGLFTAPLKYASERFGK